MSATSFLDACGFNPASGGTGDFVVSAAITGYQTPASASATNGAVYSYRAQSSDLSEWEDGFGAYTSGTTTLARTTIVASSTGSKVNFTAPPNVYITALSADFGNASLQNSGIIPSISRIATGTADGFKYVRDDRTLAYPNKAVNNATISATDWNNVQTPGVYDGASMSNAPLGSSDWFYVEVIQHSGYIAGSNVYLAQKAIGLGTTKGSWIRTCIGGSWTVWRRLDNRVLLNALTANNTSGSMQDTSSITDEFSAYDIEIENLVPVTNNIQASMRFFVSGAFQTANYNASILGSTSAAGYSQSNSSILLTVGSAGLSNTALVGLSGSVRLSNPASVAIYKRAQGNTGYLQGSSSNEVQTTTSGVYTGATAAVTGFQILASSGNWSTGTVKVFGIS